MLDFIFTSDVEAIRSGAMLAILLFAFVMMACFKTSQALAMPLAACGFVALNPDKAHAIIQGAFGEFATVAILFTAVAVPAHMIERSGAFRWMGNRMGRNIGVASLRFPRVGFAALVIAPLVATYIAAALFHNVTSILVMVPITIGLCTRYAIPSRWLLCGELVASNLGGFSTSWGDTPNIIQSAVWELNNGHFLAEVVPANLAILTVLGATVLFLTVRALKNQCQWKNPLHIAEAAAGFGQEQADMSVDRRTLAVGFFALAGFIVFQYFRRDLEVSAAAFTILAATMGEQKSRRLCTLQSLDLDLYMVLGSIFILANAINHSWAGQQLHDLVRATGGAPWAIAVTSYFGTALTEAASWASATAATTHQVNPSHSAAWALGGGICAGSSSLITAASAGIILTVESRRYPGHEVNFGRYFGFGMIASVLMLAFYSLYFTFVF